jgi:hypothetical protein
VPSPTDEEKAHEVLEDGSPKPLSKQEMAEISELLGCYHGALNNQLYANYSPDGLREKLSRINRLTERLCDLSVN